ncbi:DNA repair protein REV1 isoform X4 [Magnolia sinica]|uniref:DNA repair protein REV1 isoform X4 n=1 Tax=Magnolia sinica TaxID=86752 RepID=UPI002659399B|nr:DNA repair protein REV1 isoform X4 [Magnolia sinica]
MSFESSRSEDKTKKKKRKTLASYSSKPHTKTLGMAWGSNSPSSSKSSTRKSPFANFGSYMEEKNRKLRDQFDADASSSSLGDLNGGKGLFHGVSIFIDGFTVPSSQELRGYMLKHGGRFENYFSRHRVTHIICSNLPDSKLRNLRAFSGGLPVVKPTWVLDSVAANRILNWVPYQPEQLLNETRKQQKLSAFFALKANSSSKDAEITLKDAETTLNFQVKLETESSLSKGNAVNDALLPEVGDSIESKSRSAEESACAGPPGHQTPCEVRIAESGSSDLEDEHSVREAFHSSPDRPSATVDSSCLNDKNMKERLDSRVLGRSNQQHSTLGDPNFVENYFKNSRLHFIGTWRSRYRKRFAHLNEVKHGNPKVNALPPSQGNTIIHVDMDCFFVSVILRSHLELLDKPVAVCHSDNPKGTAEISSANYPARDYGVRAGMFVRDAKARCPHLIIFPYNFEAYEEVADQFYNILHKHCKKVQAVSCDEALLDVTDLGGDDPEFVASKIRQEIFDATGCTASAGISGNPLMARLATRTAKPNGQCFIPFEKVDDYLKNLPIKALPGVGHALAEKLKNWHIQTCGELCMVSKESKSIGAEVNWGVRLNDLKDSQDFLIKLCKEVSLRLQGCGMQGRTITLKVKKKRKGAMAPRKYMGCGDCENLSHSMTIPTATDDVDVLQRISKQLFGSFCIDVKEVRGIGLQISRLESATSARQGHEKKILRSWLASASENTGQLSRINCPAKEWSDGEVLLHEGQCGCNFTDHGKQHFCGNSGQLCIDGTASLHVNQSSGEAGLNKVLTLPPIRDLDVKVIESLPPEIISEMNEMYNGKLTDLMDKSKEKNDRKGSSLCTTSLQEFEESDSGARNEGKQPLHSSLVHQDNIPTKSEVKEIMVRGIQPASTSCSSYLHFTTKGAEQVDLMPTSLSQVDISVLQELPEELKADIIEVLPAHRTLDCCDDATVGFVKGIPHDIRRTNSSENSVAELDFDCKRNLWTGSPPKWVEKFKFSHCQILKILSELYYKSRSKGKLSSILQCAFSSFPLSLDLGGDNSDEALSSLSELLKQYIEIKIESDIEEIHICFCLLKRFSTKSMLLLQAYNIVIPHLQAYVGESYGGNLLLSCAHE